MDRDAVDRITARQHSLVTTRQFLEVSRSPESLKWAVKDGWLARYRDWRGLYIVAGAPLTSYQPLMGAALLAGPAGLVSGLAGAWLWDAPDVAEPNPEVTIFDAPARRIRRVRVRTSRLSVAESAAVRYGIPTVTASLAVVQLAQDGYTYLAERVANHLFKRHDSSPRQVLATLERATLGRRAEGELGAFCERALKVKGHDDSPAARELGVALLNAGVPPFVTQHPVEVEGHSYLLDFAWPDDRVALEYNGWTDHGTTRAAFDSDAARRSRLTAAGWRLLDTTSASGVGEVVRWLGAMLTRSRFGV